MKNVRPIYLVTGGSAVVLIFSIALLACLNLAGASISVELILLCSIGISVIAFFIFSLLIKKFIASQIKILYRSIRKGKMSSTSSKNISMYDNVIEVAAQETKEWVDERTDEISKLKEQEQYRREFLGNLAHELKTPIFSIQGYVLTLLEGGLEDETVNRKFLERASKATDRIASLLEDLDAITKMEADRFELHQKDFDIVDLASEVMEAMETPANEKNISLSFNTNYDKVIVNADRGKIAQVLTNLISNSISYGNDGGATQIRFYPMGDAIMCEISDNGPGIEAEKIPRLFERFYRVEQSRNRNEGGSGLGLSIVKHIIESHGHTINVRSTVGLGSTFYFTLKKG